MSQPPIDPILMEQSISAAAKMSKHKENLANEVAKAMPRKKKAKTSESISITKSHKAKYELVGRKIVCLSHPFGSPRATINVGLKVESGRKSELDAYNSSDIVRQHRVYDTILTHALGLAEELDNRMEADELQKICAWITKGMSDQRSTDLGSVKHAGLAYLFADGKSLEPPIAKSEDKSMRGFNHPQITRMLCPRKKLDMFDEDPDTIIGALQEGTIRTTAANWPTCFYEEGVYDPDNRAKGLFCGHAAFRDHQQHQPTLLPRMHPKYRKIVPGAWSIIKMFDDKDDWTKETLAWWNSRAFPKGHGTCEDTDSDDDMAKIRAQRARLSKKAQHPSRHEMCAAEATDFATPSPEIPSIPLPENPRVQVPSPEPETSSTRVHSSTTPTSSIFSTTTAAAIESDLSPCMSDNEVEPTRMAYKTRATDTAVPSTSAIVSELPVSGTLSSHQSIGPGPGPKEPKKKGPATKKSRRRVTKKSNGF